MAGCCGGTSGITARVGGQPAWDVSPQDWAPLLTPSGTVMGPGFPWGLVLLIGAAIVLLSSLE